MTAPLEGHRLQRALIAFEECVLLEPEPQRHFLEKLRGEDEELAKHVLRILERDRDGAESLAPLVSNNDGVLEDGQQLGAYRVLRLIGRGGMGAVYLAERSDDTYDAQVAIKLITDLGHHKILERFRQERRILAALDHPYIARVLDAGDLPAGGPNAGAPYLVMEYVDGQELDEYCESLELTIDQRLELFARVCDAVAFAHRNLVIHRDLKPSNILIDSTGTPRLLDFGIAKLLDDSRPDGVEALTLHGGGPVTPAYGSPEQILGDTLTTASDVYSLGLVLYELLTGTRPFSNAASAASLAREVENRRQPPAPSSRGKSATAGIQRIGGDLDLIVLKALHPEALRRYASAADLALDLRRYLAGLPVLAQADSAGYRLRKFVARHRLSVTAASAVLLALVAALATALFQASVARSQRQIAEQALSQATSESERAESTNDFLVSLLEAGDPSWYVDRQSKGPQASILEVVLEASERLDTQLDTSPAARADLHHIVGNTLRTYWEATHDPQIHDRALHHIEESLALRRVALGEGHPDTARAWYYRASIEQAPTERLEFLKRSIAIENQLESPSTNAPYALADAADAAARLGLVATATEFLDRAQRLMPTSALAPSHPLYLQIILIKANCAILTADFETASQLLQRHAELTKGDAQADLLNVLRQGLLARWSGDTEAERHWATEEQELIDRLQGDRGISREPLLKFLLESDAGKTKVAPSFSVLAPLLSYSPMPTMSFVANDSSCRNLLERLLAKSSPTTRNTPFEGELYLIIGRCLMLSPGTLEESTVALERSKSIFEELFGTTSIMALKVAQDLQRMEATNNAQIAEGQRQAL